MVVLCGKGYCALLVCILSFSVRVPRGPPDSVRVFFSGQRAEHSRMLTSLTAAHYRVVAVYVSFFCFIVNDKQTFLQLSMHRTPLLISHGKQSDCEEKDSKQCLCRLILLHQRHVCPQTSLNTKIHEHSVFVSFPALWINDDLRKSCQWAVGGAYSCFSTECCDICAQLSPFWPFPSQPSFIKHIITLSADLSLNHKSHESAFNQLCSFPVGKWKVHLLLMLQFHGCVCLKAVLKV